MKGTQRLSNGHRPWTVRAEKWKLRVENRASELASEEGNQLISHSGPFYLHSDGPSWAG